MPGGRKAPPSAQPRGLSRDEVRSQILAAIGEMDDAITRAEAALGKGKLLDHPILGPLTAREWRKFHLVHGVHHVKQITKLRQNGAKS